MKNAVLFLTLLAIVLTGCGGGTVLPTAAPTGFTLPTLGPTPEPSPFPTATLPPMPTSTPETLAAPVLEYPTEGTVMDNGRGDGLERMTWFFDWTDVPGAEEYVLYVIHSRATQPVILVNVPHSSYYDEDVGVTSALNDWTWKVRARASGEWGPWSELGVFDVEEMGLDPKFPTGDLCDQAVLPVDRTGPVEPLSISMPDGITIHEYMLEEDSPLDWNSFEPVGTTRAEVLAPHDAGRGEPLMPSMMSLDQQPENWPNEMLHGPVPFRGAALTAAEYRRYDGTFHRVLGKVLLGETVLLEVPEEHAALDRMFRALDATETDWYVEVGHQVVLDFGLGPNFCLLGDVVQNGESLSERYGYREAYGFQLLSGKPFYFINWDGHLGFSFDGRVSWLGFDEIPRYAEEYGGAVSPTQQWENAAAFFARRGDHWYYVEIGKAP